MPLTLERPNPQPYILVEHADTGETTLHTTTCRHWRRATYTTPLTQAQATAQLPHIDHLCLACHPTP